MEEDKKEYIQFLIRDAQYIAAKLHQTDAYPENGIHKMKDYFPAKLKISFRKLKLANEHRLP
jgi:hypothetical protein